MTGSTIIIPFQPVHNFETHLILTDYSMGTKNPIENFFLHNTYHFHLIVWSQFWPHQLTFTKLHGQSVHLIIHISTSFIHI